MRITCFQAAYAYREPRSAVADLRVPKNGVRSGRPCRGRGHLPAGPEEPPLTIRRGFGKKDVFQRGNRKASREWAGPVWVTSSHVIDRTVCSVDRLQRGPSAARTVCSADRLQRVVTA